MAGTQRHKKTGGKPAKPREGSEFLSDVIGKNIAAARAFVSLSQLDLADRMTKLGHAWYGSTVGRVEKGERAVSVEELIGLSLALHPITPYQLLTPPVDEENPTDIDLGPDSPIPTLTRKQVDRLFRARGMLLPPPPVVVWEGNDPKAWTPAENEFRLGDLLDAVEADLGTEAAKALLGRWDREVVREAIVRLDEETGEADVMGSLVGRLDGLEALDAIKRHYGDRQPNENGA